MKEKMDLGVLVEWQKIDKPNRKACWALNDTIAVFIRDYLYKFIEENKHAYPIEYKDVEEWHERLRRIAENLSIGVADMSDYDLSILENSELTDEQKIEALTLNNNRQKECIKQAFAELGEVFFDLWD